MNALSYQTAVTRLSELVRQVSSDGSCPDLLTEDSRFVEDAGLESIGRIMLMTMIEQEFSVDLEKHMASLVEMDNIGSTARFIVSLRPS